MNNKKGTTLAKVFTNAAALTLGLAITPQQAKRTV